MTLFGWLRKINGKLARSGNYGRRNTPAQRDAAARPRLEQLEERLTPTTFDTITNAAISIAPNFGARTATETITATVTNNDVGGPSPTAGNVFFNLNNMVVISAPLNSSGQATANITLPLAAVATNQTLEAFYGGATIGSNTFNSSVFLSPVYLNVLNALFSANVTFVPPPLSQASLPVTPYGTHIGESDDVTLFFVPVDFHYVDPGTIQDFTLLGFTLSGSFSASLFTPFVSFYDSLGIQVL